MRVLPVVAALILVFLGAATPPTASAQDGTGRLDLVVHMCVNPPVFPYAAYPTVVGTFDETLCYIESSSADPSQKMTIQLDGGADGFTVAESFAPLFWPDISLTPGTYTLTITAPLPDGPLVTATEFTIAANQTTALTYTVIYPLEGLGSVPPPPPEDEVTEVPEVPVDPVATPAPTEEIGMSDPVPTEEIVTSDPAPPVEADPIPPVATDPGDAITFPVDDTSVPADPVAVVSLPNTGSGHDGSRSAWTWAALGLATCGTVSGALMRRRRA